MNTLDSFGIDERFIIIKNASLTDATILDENYKYLIGEEYDTDHRDILLQLHISVKDRIKQLKKDSV